MRQKGDEYKPACYITIVAFIFELITLLSQCACLCRCEQFRDCKVCCNTSFRHLYTIIKMIFSVVMFILFCSMANYNQSLDEPFLQFVIDNKCSDPLVNYSMEQFTQYLHRDRALIGFAVFVSLVLLGLQIVFTVYFTKKLKRWFDDFYAWA